MLRSKSKHAWARTIARWTILKDRMTQCDAADDSIIMILTIYQCGTTESSNYLFVCPPSKRICNNCPLRVCEDEENVIYIIEKKKIF